MAAKLPEKMGPYIIERRIGRGGMGTIYAGFHAETKASVAIKALASSLSDDESFRHRFEKEIEALRQLRHPHIVQLFGYGQEDDTFFYSMELVQGRSLEEEIAAGRRFTWRETIHLGIQVCSALRCAHDHGIIHRDMKPANLLLANDETVKLSDFGIASLFGSTKLTDAGNVIGTIEYMAPEQATLQPITIRTDLYSFGAVLVALMSGHPPFLGKNLLEIIHLHAQYKAKRPSQLGVQIPPPMDELIGRLLERDPEKRPRNAFTVQRQLEAILKEYEEYNDPTGDTENFLLSGNSAEMSIPSASGEEKNTPSDVSPNSAAWYQPLQDAPPTSTDATVLGPVVAEGSVPPTQEDDAASVLPAVLSSSDRKTVKNGLDDSSAVRHFVRVEVGTETGDPPSAFWIQMMGTPWGVLLVILGVTALFGWLISYGIAYWTSPPPPEVLYQRILKNSEAENPNSNRLEKEVETFLAQYPSDGRAEKVQEIQSILELDRLEKRIRLFSRSAQASRPQQPVERDYQIAIRYLATRPELALQDLEAFLTVYDALGKRLTQENARKIELQRINSYREIARRQISRIHQLLAKEAVSRQKLFRSGQNYVESLEPPVNEEELRQLQKLRRAIHHMYGDAEAIQPILQKLDALLATPVLPMESTEGDRP